MRGIRSVGVLAACVALGLAAESVSGMPSGESSPEGVAAPAPATAELGQPAPDFTLTDLDGREHRLSDLRGKIVVLEWFNPDCPFVKKHHQKNKTMARTYEGFREKGIVWLAINSGAPGKQGHGAERNTKAREDYGIAYPVLLDEGGQTGRAYAAKTTPHMYVIDREGSLVYRGAIDDNASPGTLGKRNYVAECLTALCAEGEWTPRETKSYGCSVKYGASEVPPRS